MINYTKRIEYNVNTITIKLPVRNAYVLAYLERIEGAKSSNEARTWKIPFTSLHEIYRFCIRWNLPLPQNLVEDINRRVSEGENVPVLVDIFRNPARAYACRKHNLTILDDLRYDTRPGSHGSWRKAGRYAIATPAQRQDILKMEEAKRHSAELRHQRWFSQAPTIELHSNSLQKLYLEIERTHELAEMLDYQASEHNYDEGKSVLAYQAMQTKTYNNELRNLYNSFMKALIDDRDLHPLGYLETEEELHDLYVIDGHPFVSFTSVSERALSEDDRLIVEHHSKLKVSLERSIVVLICALGTMKRNIAINTPFGLPYRQILRQYSEATKLEPRNAL